MVVIRLDNSRLLLDDRQICSSTLLYIFLNEMCDLQQDLVVTISKSMIMQADLASIENMNERLCFATQGAFIGRGFSPFLEIFQMREGVKVSIQGKFEIRSGRVLTALDQMSTLWSLSNL